MRLATLVVMITTLANGQEQGRIASHWMAADVALSADPAAAHWKEVMPVVFDRGPLGEPQAGHRTAIRSRWTDRYLYVLFVCDYDKLFLKPDPVTTRDTWELWNWDVAELFIGGEMERPGHYREFQVSPQGEWIDLDIERGDVPKTDKDWNSGFSVKASIDSVGKVWYGEMRIPLASINGFVAAEPGREFRANFYRLQGPPPDRVYLAWQPTGAKNYHVPSAFGRLVLTK